MSKRAIVGMGLGAALAFVGIALLLAAAASAAPPANGSWNISGVESYSDQVLLMGNTTDVDGNATDFGNVTVEATGDLTFNNVTLILPFHSTFDIAGRVTFRNSTIDGEAWFLRVRGSGEITDNRFINATFGGTSIETTTTLIERNLWNCTNGGGAIHIKRAIDFRNQTLEPGCGVSIELPTITANRDLDYSNLTIRNTGGATAFTFVDAFHTGRVRFDLHDMVINGTGGGWGIYVGATSNTTSYKIHDMTISETGSAAIRCDSFDGGMAIYNITFTNVLRAARMDGLPNGQVVATIDNVSVVGTTDSILANDMTWVIRNSTLTGAAPQFDAGPNGHIKIYNSADTAFASNYPQAGGSIEHFAFLNMGVPTWQGGLAITDDLITLLDSNLAPGLVVNASTWTPRDIVWWGMYPNNVRVDNRQVSPKILDGPVAFNCTPSAFFVTPGMPFTPVTCTDDAQPILASVTPAYPRIQNSSVVSGSARVDEWGSGLVAVEFALDGVGYGPVAFVDGRNFTFMRAGVQDGRFNVTLRATDRAGNVRILTVGPLTVDTVSPSLYFDPPPPLVAASASYTFTGATEPNTEVNVARAGGFSNTSQSNATGAFAVGVLLEEGLNSYVITARDAAGNGYSLYASLVVDTLPPPLVVLLDGRAVAVASERTPVVHVTGTAEQDAVVLVNGQPAARSGTAFSLDLTIARGLTNLTVAATDTAGNQALWFGAAFFDDLAPTLAVEVNGVPVVGSTPVVTKTSSASLAGSTADADSGVTELIINGHLVDLDGAGGFSYVVALTEGDNTITVTASDAVGNTASVTVHVVRDTVLPGLTVAVEEDGSPVITSDGQNRTAGASVKLVILVTEAGTATFGGTPHAVAAGANPFVVNLTAGRNSIPISFVDLAGNPSVPVTLVVERKSTPPTVGISSPAAGASVDTAAVEVVGVTEPLAVVTVNDRTVPVSATGEFRTTLALTVGDNTIRVEATDALGNKNSTTRTVTRTSGSPGGNNTTPAGSGLDGMLLLVVGLGGGLVAGVLAGRMMGRSKSGMAPRPASAHSEGQAPAPADDGAPETSAPAGPARKGPRGPQP